MRKKSLLKIFFILHVKCLIVYPLAIRAPLTSLKVTTIKYSKIKNKIKHQKKGALPMIPTAQQVLNLLHKHIRRTTIKYLKICF